MSKEFEEWREQFEKTPEYLADSFHWADMAKEAFAAGRALGRREMKGESNKAIELESEHSAPCWCEDAEDGFPPKVCDCCNFIANLAERIEAMPEEV